MNTSKTLLAILVEYLPKNDGWPKGVARLAQDPDGDIQMLSNRHAYLVSAGWTGDGREDFYGQYAARKLEPLASDYATAIITREQYEAALAAKNDGWINWGGGECPVEGGVLVEVKYRNEKNYHIKGVNRAWEWSWEHHGTDGDIIAYRLHQPQDVTKVEINAPDCAINGAGELPKKAEQVRDDAWNAYAGITEVDDEADLNECIGQTTAPVWNGEGLPPVGVEFEYGSHRSRAKCLAIGLHYVFASKGNPDDEESDYEELLIDAGTEYHPVDEDRAAIRKVIKDTGIMSSYADKIANALIDAGYRKQ